ncbi:ABC transporter permease [Geodermatophilus sp. YIM 151500]|uniref:ABC transporter permease n=1 Tax=Geodermatophilus sp. YIM 151500 TaxID=2984531 RepID=UPI0021E4C86E|nr:ABC transporter permease [Geodermatophilus sp. YIM 151500]MCV2489618.1 ABC transporter permease [Geodermatophilus sp. YIM 151500]
MTTAMTSGRAPRTPGSAALVRLVAAREAGTRLRDRNFLISSAFILLLLVGVLVFQIVLNSGSDQTRIGVPTDDVRVAAALEVQSRALGIDLVVERYADEEAARAALAEGAVEGVLVGGRGREPALLVESGATPSLLTVAQGAVASIVVGDQLAAAGVQPQPVPDVVVRALDPQVDAGDERLVVALIGTALLYGLLVLFGQFIAQGVVEEKSSRVVELLLVTMRPWQLLAGKIIGLGALGLGQILVVAVLGVAGALVFDLVDVPGDLVGTVVAVVLWFVLGYAFYAAVFAVAGSLVSRQEDLGSVLTPTTLLLVAAFIVAFQAAADPAGAMATVTSFTPGLSPLVMPVRSAAGQAAGWEVALSVAIMLVAIAAVVRVGGRIYAGALLRTSGRTRLREALRAERA